MDEHAEPAPTGRPLGGRKHCPIKYIIIHAIPDSPSVWNNLEDYLVEPDLGDIFHYVIDADGRLKQSMLETNRSWSNGYVDIGADSWFQRSAENQAIGIALVKSAPMNMDDITDAQKTTVFSLIERILKRHPTIRRGTATEHGGITGHHVLAPITKFQCPGKFPWEELWRAIGTEVDQEQGASAAVAGCSQLNC